MRWGREFNSIQKAEFLQRLGYLLHQGYSLTDALELLQFSQKLSIKAKVTEVLHRLKEGQPLFKAFAVLKLPNDINSFIYFAEQVGSIPDGLIGAGNLYLKQVQVKERVSKLLRYPLFLIWLLFIVILIMVTYLFPHFKSLFEMMSVELPLVTILFLYFIDIIPFLLAIVSILILIGFTYYMTKFRHYTPHKKIALILKVPLLSSFVTSILTYFFAVQLSGLLKGGLSISQAFNILKSQSMVLFFHDEAIWLIQRLKEGEELADILRKRPYFEDELSLVIQHGQKRGALDGELLHYSDQLFTSIDEKIKKVVMILQPSMFLFIGMIVLLMFLSILLPMFEMINSLS